VLIEFLASSLAAVSDRTLVPGIAGLLNHIERQRLWIQPRVLKALDQFEASDLLKAMQDAARSVEEEAGVGDAPFVAGKQAHGHASKSVRKGVEKLFDEAPGLADPEQRKRHHAMRIAVKRLRYLLELAKPVFSENLAKIVAAVKNLQTLLGEIHDCDVWVENFTAFAEKECREIQLYFGGPQRFERLRPGLDYLRQERKDRRAEAFGELVAYWRKLEDQGAWNRLATILGRAGTKEKSQTKSLRTSPAEVSQEA